MVGCKSSLLLIVDEGSGTARVFLLDGAVLVACTEVVGFNWKSMDPCLLGWGS